MEASGLFTIWWIFEAELGYDFQTPSLGAYIYHLEHMSHIFPKLPKQHHQMKIKCSNGSHSNCKSAKCHFSCGLKELQESSSAESEKYMHNVEERGPKRKHKKWKELKLLNLNWKRSHRSYWPPYPDVGGSHPSPLSLWQRGKYLEMRCYGFYMQYVLPKFMCLRPGPSTS